MLGKINIRISKLCKFYPDWYLFVVRCSMTCFVGRIFGTSLKFKSHLYRHRDLTEMDPPNVPKKKPNLRRYLEYLDV